MLLLASTLSTTISTLKATILRMAYIHLGQFFVKTIFNPQNKKEAEFAKMQEACRKDIERAFGVLQARFAIVRGLARFWDKRTLRNIMTCCVILHNMIIEDERDLTWSSSMTMLVAM
jgi:hypothetical protein